METAIRFYKDALVYSENDSKRMLDLAGLYLMTEDLDACQHQLMTLLKNDSDNDQGTIMLADLMFRRNEYDSAQYHFQQLLDSKPGKTPRSSKIKNLLTSDEASTNDRYHHSQQPSPVTSIPSAFLSFLSLFLSTILFLAFHFSMDLRFPFLSSSWWCFVCIYDVSLFPLHFLRLWNLRCSSCPVCGIANCIWPMYPRNIS